MEIGAREIIAFVALMGSVFSIIYTARRNRAKDGKERAAEQEKRDERIKNELRHYVNEQLTRHSDMERQTDEQQNARMTEIEENYVTRLDKANGALDLLKEGQAKQGQEMTTFRINLKNLMQALGVPFQE